MKKILKRIISLFLVLSFCFTSMAAVVSDNDGSAFITKAEFDSLKNNFQAQIDQYNTSIDNKIDGAIAAYLSGIRITQTYEWELDVNSIFLGDLKWKDVGFSSLVGEKAKTVPNKEFLVGQDETYCGLTYPYNAAAVATTAGTKISEGGFDLKYKPEYYMGYMKKNTSDSQIYLDSWGLWRPHFFASVAAFYHNPHTADDSGANPEWYGFMKQEGSTSASSLTGNEWVVKAKNSSQSVTRWTIVSTSNNKWERGNYVDEFENSDKGLVFYPLSAQENLFRNYTTGQRLKLKDGFAHKLTDKFRAGTNNFITSYPWVTSNVSFTNLNLGEADPPARIMTPYLNRLKQNGTEDKYSYAWLNLSYINWSKSAMASSWPSWMYHGGPYTSMSFVSVDTSNSTLFDKVLSKQIKLNSTYSGLTQINQGIAIWKNDQNEGALQVILNLSEDGHVILYTAKTPSVTWGGTTNKYGGREQDYAETAAWTTNQQWKNNNDNTISKNTTKTFNIDHMNKDEVLFFLFLPNDTSKVGKINSFKIVLKSE